MSLAQRILRRLRAGPATNAELQDACEAHCGEVARDCSKLIHAGRIIRTDSASGRGTRATYAMAKQ